MKNLIKPLLLLAFGIFVKTSVNAQIKDTLLFWDSQEHPIGKNNYDAYSDSVELEFGNYNIYMSFGSKQTGTWIGSNNTHKHKLKLGYDPNPENIALATNLRIDTSDLYYATLMFKTKIHNVYAIHLQARQLSGAAVPTVKLLQSVDEGLNYQLIGEQEFDSTFYMNWQTDSLQQAENAWYIFVFHADNDFICRSPIVVFEGITDRVRKPYASIPSGQYYSSLFINLTARTNNSQIFYAIQKDSIESSYQLYDTTLFIDSSCILKCFSQIDQRSSDTVYYEYIINKNQNIMPSVQFSIEEGFYFSNQELIMSCPVPEVRIFYTIDGRVPDTTSILYESAHKLTSTQTIKALAFLDNFVTNKDSIKTATYNIVNLDSAALPFSFSGGRDDINNSPYMFQNGLGSDYSQSLKLKFDKSDAFLVIALSDKPSYLKYSYKLNGSGQFGTFAVQISADGRNFQDLNIHEEMSTSIASDSVSIIDDIRFIKFIYKEKISGNVSLGEIEIGGQTNRAELILYASNLLFDNTTGETDNLYIDIFSQNLFEDIRIELDDSTNFSVDKKVISRDGGQIKLFFHPEENGLYSSKLYVRSSGLSDSLEFTGLSELSSKFADINFLQEKIVLHPNPTSSGFYLETDIMVNKVDIMDSKGLVYKTFPKSFSSKYIDISDFPKGIYILRLETAYGLMSKKILKL